MRALGIDIGAVSAKAVIVSESGVIAYKVIDTGSQVKRVVDNLARTVLEDAHLSFKELKGVIATGYGRIAVPFADKKITEITCHARGVHHLLPDVRAIIDIGGQDSKGILIDEEGNVVDFVMNDKCAAGTGRFLEVMAKALELTVDELGHISLKSENSCPITSTCTVFAESEVVALKAEGNAREDIIAGIHQSIARRISAMVLQIGKGKTIALTGGVAKNTGVVKALKDEMKVLIQVPEDPQITGALGAALIALNEK